MRELGLHLRVETNLVDLVKKAKNLEVDFFQCFLTQKTEGRLLSLDSCDIEDFVKLRRELFKDLFLHISYWVNLSSVKHNEHRLLSKELALVKKLEFTHIVLHPGSAKGEKRVPKGVDALASMVNSIVKSEPEFTIVIENVAQKYPCIGGDISHFRLLLDKLDNSDRVKFCIDTAHAFSYGYDLADFKKQDEFVDFIDSQVGWHKVCLIHLNDNIGACCSHIDTHSALGEGKIGIEALKRFAQQDKLKNIPMLLEPPMMSDDQLRRELDLVKSWIK
ncbi:MAG: putative endonuclease 4 [candidate division TM6 bacterium GW2011_GWF2_30_66]|jgi:apurinic endonuclease APN1|nr:MAG: putative endonuclease 4 [candidate division TM6 bacterium GW2011_GWF2_30_66]